MSLTVPRLRPHAFSAPLDLDVETPSGEWAPIHPPAGGAPPREIVLVRALSRLDGHVELRPPSGGDALPADLATTVVAVAVVDPITGAARIQSTAVERTMVVGGPADVPGVVLPPAPREAADGAPALSYEPLPAPGGDEATLLHHRRAAHFTALRRVALEAVSRHSDGVVLTHALATRRAGHSRILGELAGARPQLPAASRALAERLEEGWRTPAYVLRDPPETAHEFVMALRDRSRGDDSEERLVRIQSRAGLEALQRHAQWLGRALPALHGVGRGWRARRNPTAYEALDRHLEAALADGAEAAIASALRPDGTLDPWRH